MKGTEHLSGLDGLMDCTGSLAASELTMHSGGFDVVNLHSVVLMEMTQQLSRRDAFTRFVDVNGVRFSRVLTARYGVEMGGDVYADAMGWAWQHWEQVSEMDNPMGYLYRVAQSKARPHRRWFQRNSFPGRMPERWQLDEDSALFSSLGKLSEPQRVAVLMVHAHNWTYAEVAEVLDCSVAAVTNHVHRGIASLRRQMGEEVES